MAAWRIISGYGGGGAGENIELTIYLPLAQVVGISLVRLSASCSLLHQRHKV